VTEQPVIVTVVIGEQVVVSVSASAVVTKLSSQKNVTWYAVADVQEDGEILERVL
jgi:hypothetical protein